jgi:hypothetical protein
LWLAVLGGLDLLPIRRIIPLLRQRGAGRMKLMMSVIGTSFLSADAEGPSLSVRRERV